MSNIPKLRFPEFSGEWEEKKLKSIFTKITQRNSDNQNSNVITNSATEGLVSQRDYFDKDIANKDKTDNYFIIKNGDFVYNPRKSSAAPYGPFTQYKLLDDGIVSPLYLCLRKNNSEVESKYLENYFKTTCWHQYIYENGSSGARHDRVSIHDDVLLAMPIKVPSLPEQQKIADFLSNVDSIITAETKILNTLQKKKKALMQKLFTRQLRFKSDDGTDFPAWEEKKLGDVCNVLSGKRVPKGNKLTSVNTGLKYITVSDMGDKFVSNKDIKYITQEIETKIKKYKVITGDIIISVAGTLGKVNIITEEFNNANLTENCDKLTEFKGCITEYLFYFLQSEKFLDEINRIKTSSAQPKLALDRLRIFVIPIPIIEEQEKIADCLSIIDSLIQTQQKVVTTWQQRKKALLQQMFI